jgi:hypothetical protein
MSEFYLPIKGISYGFDFSKQPPLTSGYMNNCRAICVLEKKIRLCQRPGLDKWGDGDQIGGSEQPVVAMCIVSSTA